MNRLGLFGVALSVAGAIGVLSLELIGTAHASRQAGRHYLLAISSGDALRLITARPDLDGGRVLIGSNTDGLLMCAEVVDLSAVSIGYRCSR